jgi:hypothetical protein
MSSPVVTAPGDGEPRERERRRSERVPLEIALQLVIAGGVHAARTVLANREGILAYSTTLCSRGSVIEARNPATGLSTRVRVAWCWVDQGDEARAIRLALEKVDAAPSVWDEAYDEKLREAVAHGRDRRRCSPATS